MTDARMTDVSKGWSDEEIRNKKRKINGDDSPMWRASWGRV